MLQKQMEGVAMIQMAKVAEFVQKDIILKDARKTDDIEIEIYIAFGRTAAPVSGIVLDCHPVVCKSISGRKDRKARR